MKQPTYEDVIQEFHKQTIFQKTGSYSRSIINFETTKYNEHKLMFEKFVQFIYRNNGQVDWKLMIEALADFFNGWFHPMFLSNPKGIKIYRNYIREKENKTNNDAIYKEVVKSVRFVSNYIIKGNLRDIDAYFMEDQYLLPSMGKHLLAGSISPFYLACIPDIKTLLQSYPVDVREEYFSDFLENLEAHKIKILKIKKLRDFSDNFYKSMKNLINKIGNQNYEKQN